MKTAIIGDRDVNEDDLKMVDDAVKASGFKITEVLCGEAKGGDTLGKKWAKKNKIPVKSFKPDWDNLEGPNVKVKSGPYGDYNALAGFNRNQDMADYGDNVIALQPNGDTNGTQDCLDRFSKQNKATFVWPQKQKESLDGYAYKF